MSKVVVNGKTVKPSKKVKLYKEIGRTNVTKLLKEKVRQLKDEQNKG